VLHLAGGVALGMTDSRGVRGTTPPRVSW
jgi:hypothetical protein